MALQGIGSRHAQYVFSYESVCVLIHEVNKAKRILNMHVSCTCATLVRFSHHSSPGRETSICFTLRGTHADPALDFKVRLHAHVSSDGCVTHASALPTSLPQFISPVTSVWALTVSSPHARSLLQFTRICMARLFKVVLLHFFLNLRFNA